VVYKAKYSTKNIMEDPQKFLIDHLQDFIVIVYEQGVYRAYEQ
jgi:hypothetical protein